MPCIYCDEAGFTGNNLLNPDQPYFVYASVLVDQNEAKNTVEKLKRNYHIQGNELKGRNLVKYNKGRKAISEILDKFSNSICLCVFHKKYNLACKFFELIFEPVLSSGNNLFYEVGFHRFISNIIYLEFQNISLYGAEFSQAFEALISRLDETYIENLSSWASNIIEVPGCLKELSEFCYHHQKVIREEVEFFKRMGGLGKWALDLTVDAMLPILSYWGERVESMEVYYDESQPLEPIREMLGVMIGRKDKISTQMRGKRQLLTFNLAQPIQPAVSRDVHGLQIADVFAAAMNYALMNPHDSWSQKWLSICEPAILHAVFPDSRDFGVDRREQFVCYLILQELVRRSLSGEDLLEQISEFIADAFSMARA